MDMPTGLADRLRDALLPTDGSPDDDAQSTGDRILDAALHRFAAVGTSATTMSSIATEAGLSRESLYRHFANRDAVTAAVVHRELQRFIDGLAVRASRFDDVTQSLTDTFVFCVEFLRDQSLVAGLVAHDVPALGADLRDRAGAAVGVAARTCAGYLEDLGGFDAATATAIAETLTRLVGSTVLAPVGALDLHDPAVLRTYAGRIIPAILAGA